MARDVGVGEELGGFRIESVIGRGGMGVVYLARDLTLDRMAALKVVIPELAGDPEFRERFLREARLAASLDHPNIVPIHHAGEVEDRLYIVMRYVRSDLRTLIDAEAPLEPERTLGILNQAASGLDAAHRRGLVHRDVKPANILIEPSSGDGDSDADRAFITDFGLVKHLDSATRLTRSGMFLGTLEYAAPEQLQGKTLDGRTDLYALGCILFECLTGTVPFVVQTEAQMMYAHVFEPPPRPSERRPLLPPALDDVLARAMAKEAEGRYPTCAALIEAAHGAVSGDRAAYAAPPMPAHRPPTETAPPPMPVSTPREAAGAASTGTRPVPVPRAPPVAGPEEGARAGERRSASPAPSVAILGVAAALLLAGLVAPIREDVGVSVDVNSLFLEERIWHLFEPVAVPLLAALAVVLLLRGIGPRRPLAGALIGIGIATVARSVQLLISAVQNAGPAPGIFLRLAGSLALVAGGVVAYRADRRVEVGDSPAGGPATGGRAGIAPWLWGAGVALVVAGSVMPFGTVFGVTVSIVLPRDPQRTWYLLEPLALAAVVLGATVWWWRGRPDQELLAGLVAGSGVALVLHFLWYAVVPVLFPDASPGLGGFLGLAGAVAVAWGGLLASRHVRSARPAGLARAPAAAARPGPP